MQLIVETLLHTPHHSGEQHVFLQMLDKSCQKSVELLKSSRMHHWKNCFLWPKIRLSMPRTKEAFTEWNQLFCSVFLSAVYSSRCVCGACGCVALKQRSSYSAIIHLVQRRAAAAQPCWLWAFGLLATTADRPQLTLAHTATFHPGRGGEEDREGKRNREVENVGDGATSRGGTRREWRRFWWFCPTSKRHFLFVREKHSRWRMEGVF